MIPIMLFVFLVIELCQYKEDCGEDEGPDDGCEVFRTDDQRGQHCVVVEECAPCVEMESYAFLEEQQHQLGSHDLEQTVAERNDDGCLASAALVGEAGESGVIKEQRDEGGQQQDRSLEKEKAWESW